MLTLSLICTAIAAVTNWSTRVWPNRTLETMSKPVTTTLVILGCNRRRWPEGRHCSGRDWSVVLPYR